MNGNRGDLIDIRDILLSGPAFSSCIQPQPASVPLGHFIMTIHLLQTGTSL